jgi:OOP family OmpA-OmpF porin
MRSIGSLKKLILIGHTDSLGSDAYNAKLGQQRAEFVASQLIRRGVPKRLITVKSRGRTEPVAIRPGETDEQFRLRSRRVEFVKVF